MFHANHGQFNKEDLSGKIVLSEGDGLEVLNPSIEIEEAGVHIKCDLFESGDVKKREAARYIKAAGIVVLINPMAKACPVFHLMTFQTKSIPIEQGEKFSAKVEYIAEKMVEFQLYAVKKAFAVFITVDGEWNLTDISKTFESDINRIIYID